MSGRRLCVWIPEDKLWIFDAIEFIRKAGEEEGARLTDGFIIVNILSHALATYESPTSGKVPTKEYDGKGHKRKRFISFRKQDQWLLDAIDKVLKTKKDLGLPANFSFELVRLARCGLVKNLTDGAKLDKKSLGGDDDSASKTS